MSLLKKDKVSDSQNKKELNQAEHIRKLNQIAFQGGSYSLAMTAIVFAILVLVNILVSALPSSMTRFDISSTKLYSITSNTKVVVNGLEDDVTIYWVVQTDQEDGVIEHLLSKYESLSGHINVVKKNPDVYPTFTENYTSESVSNNSLIVESGDKNRYIAYEDIYLTEADYTTGSYTYSFDGEGAITSAIDYVVSEDQPKLYLLEGHGEADLSGDFASQIEKSNIDTASFSLLTEKEVPEDADGVLIYSPASDISTEERDILADYAKNGGKLLVLAGPVEDGTLTNLYSLLNEYGVTTEEGVVVESDQYYYALGYPYVLLPNFGEHEITSPINEAGYYAILPIAQGMVISNTAENVTPLLTTSETAFAKAAGYGLTTYDKEDGDIDGPFALGVAIDCDKEGQIIWFSTSYLMDDMYNAYSSGANLDLGMNAITFMIGESEAVAIQSKSMGASSLTIAESTASFLKVMMIGVLPLTYLGVGIVVIVRRRKVNEAF